MASIRESESRAIFAAADRNGDGSLTFSEWLDWLGNGDDSFKLGFLGGKSSTSIYDSSAEDVDSSITASLGIVLSHAVAALKVLHISIAALKALKVLVLFEYYICLGDCACRQLIS